LPTFGGLTEKPIVNVKNISNEREVYEYKRMEHDLLVVDEICNLIRMNF
jgi:hypothetical protein